MRDAYGLQEKISALEAHITCLQTVLDRMTLGVVLLDSRRKIVFCNTEAQQLCAQQIGLVQRDDEIRAICPSAQKRLSKVLDSACRGLQSKKSDPLLLSDANGQIVVSATSQSILEATTFAWPRSQVTAILLVQRLCASAATGDDNLRNLFHLTTAEARLAALLCTGLSLAEAARQLGKSVNTVRSQLCALFEKTGTHRQIDLVRLLGNADGIEFFVEPPSAIRVSRTNKKGRAKAGCMAAGIENSSTGALADFIQMDEDGRVKQG